jgi:aspartokinase
VPKTDAWLKAASPAAAGDERSALELLAQLQLRHEAVSRELLDNPAATVVPITELFAELRSLLEAVCALRELTPLLGDRIVSYGERLSTVIVRLRCGRAQSLPNWRTRARASSTTIN